MKFITFIYSANYVPMLVTLLESSANKNINLIVGYSNEINKKIIKNLSKVYINVQFEKVLMPAFSLNRNLIYRHHINASRKIIALRELFLKKFLKDSFTCFIDVDTFFTKLWREPNFEDHELLMTIKDNQSRYRLNSGVIFLKNNEKAKDFLRNWEDNTIKIVSDKLKLKKAVSKSNPYGGGDQMSLYKLTNLEKNIYSKAYQNKEGLKIALIPTKIYNACEEKVYSDLAQIVHLKGAFHSLLLEGKPFFSDRVESKSIFQLELAYDYNKKACNRILETSNLNKNDIGKYFFRKPSFLDKNYNVKNYIKLYFRIKERINIYLSLLKIK